ncbi:MAG: hypothetical protein ACK56I_02345, partial [bacterium]
TLGHTEHHHPAHGECRLGGDGAEMRLQSAPGVGVPGELVADFSRGERQRQRQQHLVNPGGAHLEMRGVKIAHVLDEGRLAGKPSADEFQSHQIRSDAGVERRPRPGGLAG